MSVVEGIEKKNAERKIREVVQELAETFGQESEWVTRWAKRFRGAMVGKGERPEFTEQQIEDAFEILMQRWKYNSPPKPADLSEIARELRPLPAMQKAPAETKPPRVFTDAQRKANKARIAELNRRTFENMDRIRKAAQEHGYGSPEATRITDECRESLKAWIADQQREMRAEGL